MNGQKDSLEMPKTKTTRQAILESLAKIHFLSAANSGGYDPLAKTDEFTVRVLNAQMYMTASTGQWFRVYLPNWPSPKYDDQQKNLWKEPI